MFGFGKKKEVGTAEVVPQTVAEEMGLREYVSIDSLKAHLVDMMEENRRLKQEKENEREYQRKKLGECEKAKELALVTADEWKKRAGEKEKEIKELKKTINQQDEKISELEKMQNHWKSEAELARAAADRAHERAKEQSDCRYWLKEMLERYGNWESVTKTQLVDILKTAMREEKEREKDGNN